MIPLALALLLLSAPPPAEAERLFALGVALAEEGDARGAAAAFEEAHRTGWTSPALALNLAALYLDAGDFGRARLHAERALRLAPRDGEAQEAARRTARAAGELPGRAPSPGGAFVAWAGRRLGAAGALALAGVLWAAALAFVGGWAVRRSARLGRAAIGVVPVAVAALALAVAVSVEEGRPRAVTLAETPLRAAPDAGAPADRMLSAGRLVVLGRQRGAWHHVRPADGPAAWADADALARLDG